MLRRPPGRGNGAGRSAPGPPWRSHRSWPKPSTNSIQLIGRLTADPELRFTGGRNPVCTIRLTVPGRYRKGENDPRRTHINVVTYSGQAEAVANHMAKSRRGGVTGEYREWKERRHQN